MPPRRRLINHGDLVAIEKDDDRSTIGTFVRESDDYVVVRGTVGDQIGKQILVPRARIVQIVVLKVAEYED